MPQYGTNVIQIPIQPTPIELSRINVPLLGVVPRWRTSDYTLRWNAKLGGASTTTKAVTADFGTASADQVENAFLSIGSYRVEHVFELLTTDMANAAARGNDELANMFNVAVADGKREILKQIGTLIITGSGNLASAGVVGLNSVVATNTSSGGGKETSTNAYAGLNPTTSGYEKWTNLVYPSFGTLTPKKLADFDADLRQGTTTGVKSNYDLIAMSPTTAVKYGEVFQSTTNTTVSVGQGMDLGYGTKAYNGRPIIEDPNIANGEIHFLDTTQLRLYSFDETPAPMGNLETPTSNLLLYWGELKTENLQKKKFGMYSMVQLMVRDRTAHNVIKGVTV